MRDHRRGGPRRLDAITGRSTLLPDISHSCAIGVAKTEQQDGENPDAVALAEKIEADQTTEIADMKDLLAS
ncbi:MAG TPA: DUF305 domain-containing protein [Nocardioidaceae bacterium]|nr:DUF305 domain-containing protein [Nocardioidaceae bacterium]